MFAAVVAGDYLVVFESRLYVARTGRVRTVRGEGDRRTHSVGYGRRSDGQHDVKRGHRRSGGREWGARADIPR